MRKLIILALLSFSATAFASTVGANHGHHGGGNSGAMGAAAGAFGGGSAGASGQGQSGNGGSYWSPNPNASAVDAYQPWPQSQMARFAKPNWSAYKGD